MKRILSILLIALGLCIPHSVTGYTSVYLVNNTPFTFNLEMSQTRGMALAAPYYEQLFKGPVTPYMRSTELYTFSRATKITNGETFDFAVLIKYGNDYLAAYQSVTGTAIDSTMVQSMGGPNVTPTLENSDAMGPRYTTWHLPFGDIQVTYERYFTGGSDDLQITLGYTHPALEGADDPNILNVLTYNLYMRPRTFLKNGQMERAALIPDYVRGFDVIIFNEAFDDDARKILLDALRDEYPNQTTVVAPDPNHPLPCPGLLPPQTNGGVVIISKHPFIRQVIKDPTGKQVSVLFDEILYCDCSADDCLATKGAAYAIINKKGVPYHIFATHANAQPDPTAQEMRKRQFQQLRKFIDSKNIPANERVLVGGDMNVDMTKFPQEYQQMLNILQVTHPKVVGVKDPTDGNIYTADPKTNKLVGDKNPQEFLDYIFYENNHKKPTLSYNEVRPIKSSTGWKEYFFETEYFDLSDHYPVYGHFKYE